MRNLRLSEIGENTVVILSTHIVEDVKELCTKMAVINQGEVLLNGSPADALAALQGKIWRKQIEKEEIEAYKNNFNVISEKRIAGKPVIHVMADTAPDAGFRNMEPDLEDVYFSEIFGKRELV